MNETYPKVLICAPQHESKMYAWNRWYERANNLTYRIFGDYEIFIADNSATKDNCDYLNTFENVTAVWTKDSGKGLLHRINDSHKQLVNYAKQKGYKWILHLETDVIPPLDVIERLMARNRPIVSGVYDIFFGEKRKAMVQVQERLDRTIKAHNVVNFLEHAEPLFFDGTTKQVYHAGIGCCLIHIDVFNQIKFRVENGFNFHTDTWFCNDCFIKNIKIEVDTTVLCDHYNQSWFSNIDELKLIAEQ